MLAFYSGSLPGISSDVLSAHGQCRTSTATAVRQCPLISGGRGWGPAVPTEIWSSLLGEGGRKEGRKAGRQAGREGGRGGREGRKEGGSNSGKNLETLTCQASWGKTKKAKKQKRRKSKAGIGPKSYSKSCPKETWHEQPSIVALYSSFQWRRDVRCLNFIHKHDVNLGRHMVRIDCLAIPQPNNTHPLFPKSPVIFPFHIIWTPQKPWFSRRFTLDWDYVRGVQYYRILLFFCET